MCTYVYFEGGRRKRTFITAGPPLFKEGFSLTYPGYHRFFLACDEELFSHFEDSKPETAHENPLAPRVSLTIYIHKS